MFGNNGNYNRSNSVNVNTRLFTSYGEDSLLVIQAWNANLSIKFHPVTGKNADGITQYANDISTTVNVVITPDNGRALLDGINNVIIPAIKNKEDRSIAVKTGNGDSMKIFCVATQDGVPYVYAARNTLNGIASDENVIKHHFQSRSYLADYTYTSGNGVEVSVPTGFKNFVARLERMDNLIPDIHHSMTYSNAIKSSIANNNNSFGSSTPKYEAPVNSFSGSSSEEFLPFA